MLVGVEEYLRLYQAVVRCEWYEAMHIISEHPEALRARISMASETALHIAVKVAKDQKFIELLIRRMSPEDLALTDQNGDTALAVAAKVGNIEAANLLVSRNSNLPHILGTNGDGFAIHRAADHAQYEMIKYLLLVTRNDVEPSPFAGEFGGKLLISVITAEYFGEYSSYFFNYVT